MRMIDTNQLLEHVEGMINTLEFDSMRSPGKTKMNAATLVALYALKDRYVDDLSKVSKKAAAKTTE